MTEIAEGSTGHGGTPRRFCRRALAALAALAALVAPSLAEAAACCTSATSFGVGRLLLWEDFAVGLQVGHARSLGQYDANGVLRWNPSGFSEGITQAVPWAIVRVNKKIQLQAWVPVVLNDRASGEVRQVGGGLGDIGVGGRFELLGIGEIRRLPSFAITLTAFAPTGHRVEQTSPPLFAGTTGRGAFGGSFAFETEYAYSPWFARLDAGVSFYLPFERADTGQRQLYGPLFRASLSGGREVVPDVVVLALAVSEEVEGYLRTDGAVIADSLAHALSVTASASWRINPHFTLIGALSNSLWPDRLAMNRDARVGFNVGLRYGYF